MCVREAQLMTNIESKTVIINKFSLPVNVHNTFSLNSFLRYEINDVCKY